ncbi:MULTISPECIES: copper chaperone PCu(A)C [Pseudomonas]|jgi:hypothetical protein|uniref:Copper chaperone PCu(A)C n=1 Tax=Pseudomonas psychrophila TaxID=122355 RepID=A0A8I1FSN0_9PSED|nr:MULTISPECIES: copper chaperone PCu(A)C [Pseudomonas]KOX62693.1 transporter [Pseudomonas psychrophila]MBJ2256256.1 copper chaperone PCu(A)C [Pseudomonas psychrophila]MDY7580444.1 copper chaperone PCu(A)C [Pseudomonas sp. CCI3.1]MEB0067291.1 copper chaperone PCu(A)C [Pseudomonas sp. CCI3.1]MEB0072886.1 copper chaperone PCu(A)C [Pseudomonas sp. CCI1.4]
MKPVNYLLLSLLGMSLHVSAQTVVDDAWVRATVAGQPSTGAFMHITASSDSKLVEVQSPAAKTVQIHESKMENDVMSMQPVASVPLPAGKSVAIVPEGYHVMLIDLVGQIKVGDQVPLTLIVEDSKGVKESIEVKAQARALNSMPMHHDHGAMH